MRGRRREERRRGGAGGGRRMSAPLSMNPGSATAYRRRSTRSYMCSRKSRESILTLLLKEIRRINFDVNSN